MANDLIRVCLVSDVWEPDFSGAALRFKGYLPGLLERGVTLDVLTGTPPSAGPDTAWDALPHGATLPGTVAGESTVSRVKLPLAAGRRRKLLFDRAVVRHVSRTRPQVCHYLRLGPLRSLGLPAVRRAGVASLFTGTLVADRHTSRLKQRRRRELVRFPLSRVDHVVASSSVMERYFRSLGVRTPITIIPNGVNTERYRPPRSVEQKRTERSRLGVPLDREMILFVGKVNSRKGVDLLLQAFAQVAGTRPAAELYIVGPREEIIDSRTGLWAHRLEELQSSLGISHRVRFVGESNEVEGYMRAADVFVLPSRREGMGNVVLEAMASGLPCVLTPFLGLAEELGQPGRDYVLSSFQPDTLARDIDRLLSDSSLRSEIGAHAQRWVREEQDVNSSIGAYADLYRTLAGGKLASSRGG